ncbi:hypothetical protein Tco_1285862 [Tanacetum coccineum]
MRAIQIVVPDLRANTPAPILPDQSGVSTPQNLHCLPVVLDSAAHRFCFAIGEKLLPVPHPISKLSSLLSARRYGARATGAAPGINSM